MLTSQTLNQPVATLNPQVAQQATAGAQSVLTPAPTRTSRPSATPRPTATPQPTVTPLVGWRSFEGQGFQIWLPERYEGGDAANGLPELTTKLEGMGPDYAGLVQYIRDAQAGLLLLAVDMQNIEQGILTNVNIVTSPATGQTLMEMMADTERTLPSGYRVTEMLNVSLEAYPAGRMIVELPSATAQLSELVYIIQVDQTVWVITYATSREAFRTLEPEFVQSVQTFRVMP
jgi:hypothetical protein